MMINDTLFNELKQIAEDNSGWIPKEVMWRYKMNCMDLSEILPTSEALSTYFSQNKSEEFLNNYYDYLDIPTGYCSGQVRLFHDYWDEIVIGNIRRYIELSKNLVELLARETRQTKPDTYLAESHAYDWLQNKDDILLDGIWSYEIHGEHCLFINKSAKECIDKEMQIEVYLPDYTSVDLGFFLKYIATNRDTSMLNTWFDENGFSRMCQLFDLYERKGYLKKSNSPSHYQLA